MTGRTAPAPDVVYALGEVRVAVRTDRPQMIAYLGDFYAHADDGARPYWRIEPRLATPGPFMDVDSYGVGWRADMERRVLHVWSPDPGDLQISVRKAVREVMVAYCERRRYAMFRASAVRRDGLLIVFAGDKGAGKTTLALDAVVGQGFEFISDDHLIVYRQHAGDRLTVTSLLTLIPVKIDTYMRVEDELPPPWNANGIDVDYYRTWPTEELRGLDVRLDYTFASFGQPNPVAIPCGPGDLTRVVVVFPEFSTTPRQPRPGGVAGDLEAHPRIDWVYGTNLNPRHLPYPHRPVEQFVADSADLAAELCDHARIMTWEHAGQVGPLIDLLTACPTARAVGGAA